MQRNLLQMIFLLLLAKCPVWLGLDHTDSHLDQLSELGCDNEHILFGDVLTCKPNTIQPVGSWSRLSLWVR